MVILDHEAADGDIVRDWSDALSAGIGTGHEAFFEGVLAVQDGSLIAAVKYVAGFGLDLDMVGAGRKAESGADGRGGNGGLDIGGGSDVCAGAGAAKLDGPAAGCTSVVHHLGATSEDSVFRLTANVGAGGEGGYQHDKGYHAHEARDGS